MSDVDPDTTLVADPLDDLLNLAQVHSFLASSAQTGELGAAVTRLEARLVLLIDEVLGTPTEEAPVEDQPDQQT